MDELHKIPYTGHSGYQKMITATRKQFCWSGLKKYIANYLAKCLECQQFKAEDQHPAGLLHPLPIPEVGNHLHGFYHRIADFNQTK